jgi:hypothetical protein
MAIKRRTGLNGGSSGRAQVSRAGISRSKKSASKKAREGVNPFTGEKMMFKAKPRTRTSLVGATIYQPDLKPSPVGQRLLEALES